ncbi:MAG TPA: class A beta-lactamase, subclass A2 [Bacteroidales bacterium]
MKKIGLLLLAGLAFVSCNNQKSNNSLNQEIEKIAQSKNAEVGVAVLGIENRELYSFNGNKHFPMQSVYKLHLALAVLNQVDEGKLLLSQKIQLTADNLLPNTWSPLREKYPRGDTAVLLSEIIGFTVSQSDNNGCDILFGLVGGPGYINNFLHNKGIAEVSIISTEQEMHLNPNLQFENWTTPLAAVQLLDMFYNKKMVSDSSTQFLLQLMIETTTGPNRIKGQLPHGTPVAHKTGSSGKNSDGITAATNDIGIVELPDGTHYAIAVFVTNSTEPEEINDQIIAEVSLAAYNYFLQQTNTKN